MYVVEKTGLPYRKKRNLDEYEVKRKGYQSLASQNTWESKANIYGVVYILWIY